MKKFLSALLIIAMVAGMLGSCNGFGGSSTTTSKDNIDPTVTTTQNPDGSTSTTTTTTTKPDASSTTTTTTTTTRQPDGTTTTTTVTTTTKVNSDGTTTTTTTTTDGGSDPVPDVPPVVEGDIEVILKGYSFETIYLTWKPFDGAQLYNVYCNGKLVDKELVRYYGEYYRCDILGLSEGTYTVDIIPVVNGYEIESAKTTIAQKTVAHIREGFAFVGGTASGAYNEDGTLKSNAVVVYVTNENKDTVSLDMRIDKNNVETRVGIQNIILGLKKGYYEYPLCIRFIGNIEDPAVLEKGDLKVDINKGAFNKGLTIEGVGDDATINGFGICVKGATNVEIRNLGFMNCNSDEGDNISLQQDNDHIWVHNCDLFYGMKGKDADQAKGDGALDTKTSTNITISFNHFVDTGKSNLQGMKSESTENCVTYHHNWYDHSDSRHPRVRTCTVHVYNNYYDGVAKYGVGATMGSSVFVENNYFRNSNYAMLASKQGTDALGEGTFSGENGGIIKAYGNTLVGCKKLITYQENNTSFDCYLASSRYEKVPSSVVTLAGGTTYNNFDTASTMYKYNVESADDCVETVKNFAGRVGGGDFKWTFTAADDTDYSVNTALKAALVGYKSKLVSTNVTAGSVSGGDNGGDNSGNGDGGTVTPTPTPTPEGSVVHNFTESGKTSSFFTINGNLSDGKGSVTYNGLTLTQCLKMESSTSISFTLTESKTLILVFGGSTSASGQKVKIDGEKQTIGSDGVLSITLEAGTHTITKGDSINLFYMILEDVK